jgi:hypothetical protein
VREKRMHGLTGGGWKRSPHRPPRQSPTLLILWIAFFLFNANTSNGLVSWIQRAANWLAGWSRGMFTVRSGDWSTVLHYGLPAFVYLLIGHTVAGRVSRS